MIQIDNWKKSEIILLYELYTELRIDKDKVLKLREIREILLHPSKEGLRKIISITSLSDFDRVRGQFQKLKYEGYKLTLDMANVIDTRTRELFNNQIKSNISIDDADIHVSDKKVEELERQLTEMKELILQMSAQKLEIENVSEKKSESINTTSTTKTGRKPGRPPKKA